jgi:hypothetical protein
VLDEHAGEKPLDCIIASPDWTNVRQAVLVYHLLGAADRHHKNAGQQPAVR